jgi:predicted nucleotidyltransferase
MDLFQKFLTVVDALENEGVDYVLIGGYAVIIYGMPRLTQDIDLFIKANEINISKLKNALKSVFKDDSIEEITLEELQNYSVIRYGTPDGFSIDLITKLGEKFRFEELNYEHIFIEGHTVKIATPEVLYKMKEDTVRPDDKRDAFFLREIIENRKKSQNGAI